MVLPAIAFIVLILAAFGTGITIGSRVHPLRDEQVLAIVLITGAICALPTLMGVTAMFVQIGVAVVAAFGFSLALSGRRPHHRLSRRFR